MISYFALAMRILLSIVSCVFCAPRYLLWKTAYSDPLFIFSFGCLVYSLLSCMSSFIFLILTLYQIHDLHGLPFHSVNCFLCCA